LDWEVWRIVAAERFSVSNPNEILQEWSLEDLVDAHDVLDMYDDLASKARAPRT
jgi:hypothetical protein